jgi:excisionase family DNA binding protein
VNAHHDSWLTVQGAAVRVQRHVSTIERWIACGDLAVFHSGRTRFVREDLLLAALRKNIRENPTRKIPLDVANDERHQ